MIMKQNIGTADKAIRILTAIVVAILVYTKVLTGTAGIVLSLISVVFALTSLVGICPLYLLFGFNTCKINKPK